MSYAENDVSSLALTSLHRSILTEYELEFPRTRSICVEYLTDPLQSGSCGKS